MVDRKKIEQERIRVVKTFLIRMNAENTQTRCLGFDSRIDNIKTKEELEREEHYVIVKEPCYTYLTHAIPDNGNLAVFLKKL
jgi:predicted metal-dependent phosphoesterase TrpH